MDILALFETLRVLTVLFDSKKSKSLPQIPSYGILKTHSLHDFNLVLINFNTTPLHDNWQFGRNWTWGLFDIILFFILCLWSVSSNLVLTQHKIISQHKRNVCKRINNSEMRGQIWAKIITLKIEQKRKRFKSSLHTLVCSICEFDLSTFSVEFYHKNFDLNFKISVKFIFL